MKTNLKLVRYALKPELFRIAIFGGMVLVVSWISQLITGSRGNPPHLLSSMVTDVFIAFCLYVAIFTLATKQVWEYKAERWNVSVFVVACAYTDYKMERELRDPTQFREWCHILAPNLFEIIKEADNWTISK